MSSVVDANHSDRRRRHRRKHSERAKKDHPSSDFDSERSSRSTPDSSLPKLKWSGHSRSDTSTSDSSSDSSHQTARSLFIPGITGRPRCLAKSVSDESTGEGEISNVNPLSVRGRFVRNKDEMGISIFSQLIQDMPIGRVENYGCRSALDITRDVDEVQGFLAEFASKQKK